MVAKWLKANKTVVAESVGLLRWGAPCNASIDKHHSRRSVTAASQSVDLMVLRRIWWRQGEVGVSCTSTREICFAFYFSSPRFVSYQQEVAIISWSLDSSAICFCFSLMFCRVRLRSSVLIHVHSDAFSHGNRSSPTVTLHQWATLHGDWATTQRLLTRPRRTPNRITRDTSRRWPPTSKTSHFDIW